MRMKPGMFLELACTFLQRLSAWGKHRAFPCEWLLEVG